MKKIIFVIRDRCVGGFTSSLSSWYDAIKDKYDVEILQLTDMGNANVSYQDSVMKLWWLSDFFYGDFTLARGLRKLYIGLVRLWSKVDKKLERRIANHYVVKFADADCIIAFGEGFASRFTSNIMLGNKVAWIHNDISHYPKSQRDLNLYKKFDKVVCVADTIAEGMKNMYPSISDKVVAIHNIIDEKRIKKLSNEDIDVNFDECFNIISLGRLALVKRFSIIPSIANVLKVKGVSFKWWILGPATDPSQKELLINEINNQGVVDCVEWIGNRTNPYPYIKKSDVLVSTSSTEACPMVFTEAKALGIPIISADFLTAKEFVSDGEDGIICPIDEMADKIYGFIKNKELQERIKSNLQKRGTGNADTLLRFEKLVNI